MTCLIAVETVNGASVQTLEGVAAPDGTLDAIQAAFLEGFATQCGFCTAGMIMAAEALLARNPDPSARGRRRGDLRQRLSLHGLRADHRGDPRRRRAQEGGARMTVQTERIDPSYFREEREGDFDVIGTPVQRSDALGHVTGRTEFFEDTQPAGLLHLKMHRSERHHALLEGRRRLRRARGPGRRPGAHPRGRAGQLVHDPAPDRRRAERRAGAARGPRAASRASRSSPSSPRARGGARGRGRGQGRLRGPAGGVRRRGGARRGHARDQAARHELLRLRGPPLPADPLRRRRAGLRRGRPRLRVPLPVGADRARADGDDRLHRRARSPTAGCGSTPTRRRASSRSTTRR